MKKSFFIPIILFCICSHDCLASGLNTSGVVFTPTTEIAEHYVADFTSLKLGRVVSYETGFGGVMVKTTGNQYSLLAPYNENTEFFLSRMDYTVNSYFPGAGGRKIMKCFSFSSKLVWPTKRELEPGSFKYGMEYRFLKGSLSSDIHHVYLFGGTRIGKINTHAGLNSYFGSDIDTELGLFGNLKYRTSPYLEFFAEYGTRDYLKTITNNFIPNNTTNIGTINMTKAPKDALSVGFTFTSYGKYNFDFILYDIGTYNQPIFSFSRDF